MAIYGIADEEIDTQKGTEKFARDNQYEFPVLFDAENALVKKYGIKAFPKTFLVDHRGEVVWIGDPRKEGIETELKHRLLGQPRPSPAEEQTKNPVTWQPAAKQSDSEDEQLATYSGRSKFRRMEQSKPAIRGKLSEQIENIKRYDLPFLALGPKSGQVVADIGSGPGKFLVRILEAVGDQGNVYCRDINQAAINSILKKAESKGFENVDAKVSKKDNVKLPDNSIDLALLSDVYHFVVHQKTTKSFLDSLFHSMKPGGIVVVTHVTTQKLSREDNWNPYFQQIVKDFASHGFETGRRWILNDKHDKRPMLVLEFRRPSEKSDGKSGGSSAGQIR